MWELEITNMYRTAFGPCRILPLSSVHHGQRDALLILIVIKRLAPHHFSIRLLQVPTRPYNGKVNTGTSVQPRTSFKGNLNLESAHAFQPSSCRGRRSFLLPSL